MTLHPLTTFLRRFCKAARGTISVEAVVIIPVLFWAINATYEFFEIYRFKSAREKASYTIVDMISREQADITQSYLDGAKNIFDDFTRGDDNQLRVTIMTYDAGDDEYSVVWSAIRGNGPLNRLTTQDVKNRHAMLPMLPNGGQLIQVESYSEYETRLSIKQDGILPVSTRVFTSPRFVEQIKCPSCSAGV